MNLLGLKPTEDTWRLCFNRRFDIENISEMVSLRGF